MIGTCSRARASSRFVTLTPALGLGARRVRGPRRRKEALVATTTRVPRLPTLTDIDEADEKLGSFMSSLDWFRSEAEMLDRGRDISLDVLVAMGRANIDPPDDYSYEHDDKTFARLLVLADELERDADTIRKDAEKLRQALLGIYRHRVHEGNSQKPDVDDA
jgi:Txe/YoeB family toxin of Txe-Axe toxin-antitoxin module